MKFWVELFKVRLKSVLQYRTAAVGGILIQIAWGLLNIMIYEQFYCGGNVKDVTMTYEQLVSYIWLQQSFFPLYMIWLFDYQIFNSISEGTIAYELCRPCNLYDFWFAKNFSDRMSKGVLRTIPVLIVAFMMPSKYRLMKCSNIIMFIVGIGLSFVLTLVYIMLIYVISCYTISSVGVRLIFSLVADFLSGAVVPIVFMPDILKKVVYLTPFGYMQNMAFLTYTGNLGLNEMIKQMLIQIIWIIVLLKIGKYLFSKVLHKIQIVGG